MIFLVREEIRGIDGGVYYLCVNLRVHMHVTSAAPSSCSKPPSSRWDRALGYPPPKTGNPPIPPAVGDSSSVGRVRGLPTPRLTEWVATSLCTDPAWFLCGTEDVLTGLCRNTTCLVARLPSLSWRMIGVGRTQVSSQPNSASVWRSGP